MRKTQVTSMLLSAAMPTHFRVRSTWIHLPFVTFLGMRPGLDGPQAFPVLAIGDRDDDQLDVVTPWAEGWRTALRQLKVELERSQAELGALQEQLDADDFDSDLGIPGEFFSVVEELVASATRRLEARVSRARLDSEMRVEQAREQAAELLRAVTREEMGGLTRTPIVTGNGFARMSGSQTDHSRPHDTSASPGIDNRFSPSNDRTLDLAFDQYWQASGSDELLRGRETFWGELYQTQGHSSVRPVSGGAQ